MLTELPEADARGEVASVYDEIRRFCQVPYVSSLQRHLATRPGWLEWAWHSLRPAFVSGEAPAAGWATLDRLTIAPLPGFAPDALAAMNLTDDDVQAVRNVCESFVRVSPTNLMQSGMLRRFLRGHQPSRPGQGSPEAVHASLPTLAPLPAMVVIEGLPPAERDVLMAFSVEVDGAPFVPGVYRMLARWPQFFAKLAEQLVPRLNDPATNAACNEFLARIDGAADRVFESLPRPTRASPPHDQFPAVLDVLERYRQTSPQMVVYGMLIRDSLAHVATPSD
ncbi:MAG: hypothetical protein AAF493_01945 [Pseudomonadota bacterium]